MLHKLRAAMVRPGRDRIGTEWPVEVDETYVSGATHGEGPGRHHKTLVVGMVEVLPRKKALGPDPICHPVSVRSIEEDMAVVLSRAGYASRLSRTASRKRWHR